MARAARIQRTGGPEVIEWVDVDLPAPGEGEVRVRNTAVGLNYIDAYHRSGVYPVKLPSGLGSEAAGDVEVVGPGVDELAVGDRVAGFGPTLGAYATERNVAASELFKLPDDVDDRTAAAIMVKGCTTEALVERCARVETGQTVLVWAAAGGVGHLMTGWLHAIGARVIGVVGSDAKAEQARNAGADEVLGHRREDVAARVRALTDDRGATVVFDGVGQATWATSLKAAARRGLIVSFGNAGGSVEGVKLAALAQNGSLFVSRPTLFDYYATPEERQAGVERVFAMLRDGSITPEIGQTFPLKQAADAHRALEVGETHGSTLLLP